MRCPFLREAHVKYCQASAIKKMIVRMQNNPIDEKCSSSNYTTCPSLKQYHEEYPQRTRCPFLQESLVQYCSASSMPKYVPYSESSIIRCGNEGHRYCDLFLSIAATNDVGAAGEPGQGTTVNGIHLPAGLSYSTNHMWLDQSVGGMCYVGVDEFLSRIFQHIDTLNFLPSNNSHLQTVVLTVHGVDLQMVFPIPMNVTRVNSYLRADVQKLISHPYSLGWLYEGTLIEAISDTSPSTTSPMVQGEEAVQWLKSEVHHLSEFIHNQIIPNQGSEQTVMMDGGIVRHDFLEHLNKQELLHLFNEFFSKNSLWSKTK
jgi:glycine cleavage system H lipoate-binding protein